jgi:hypothetical protein
MPFDPSPARIGRGRCLQSKSSDPLIARNGRNVRPRPIQRDCGDDRISSSRRKLDPQLNVGADGHPQCRQRQFGAQMILYCPADDPAAVEVHDGSQIEPALIGLDVGDVGELDPVRRGGSEVPLK